MVNRYSPVLYTAPAANASPDSNGITTRWERLPQRDRDMLTGCISLKRFLCEALPHLVNSPDDNECVAHFLMGFDVVLPDSLRKWHNDSLLPNVTPIMQSLLRVNRYSCFPEVPEKTWHKLEKLLKLVDPGNKQDHQREAQLLVPGAALFVPHFEKLQAAEEVRMRESRGGQPEWCMNPDTYVNFSAEQWKAEIDHFVENGGEDPRGEFVGPSRAQGWEGETYINSLIMAAVSANRRLGEVDLEHIPKMFRDAFGAAHRPVPERVQMVLDRWSEFLKQPEEDVTYPT